MIKQLDDPKWLLIVRDYPDNSSGPTIPFVIGALRDPVGASHNAREGRAELRRLLLDMERGAPDGSTVKIKWCTQLREFVAESYPAHVASRFIPQPSVLPTALSWTVEDEAVPDLATLECFLWHRYEDAILKQRFSLDDRTREWREFTPDERYKIRATFGARS